MMKVNLRYFFMSETCEKISKVNQTFDWKYFPKKTRYNLEFFHFVKKTYINRNEWSRKLLS